MAVERGAMAAAAHFHVDLSAVEQADPGSLTVDDVGRHVQRHLAAVKAPASPQVAQAAAAVPPAAAGEGDLFAGLYGPGEFDAGPPDPVADPVAGSVDPADALAIEAAVARGAFGPDRADYWLGRSATGERVAATVSSLTALDFPVSRRPMSAGVADEVEDDDDFRALYGPPPEDPRPAAQYRGLFPSTPDQ